MSKFARIGPIPPDFDVILPTLNALEDELKRKSSEVIQGRSRAESTWLVPQIDWQRTRYVHDMYYKYGRISKECYDYCVRNKIINSKLSEKWLEQGYERLCSLHAIDSRNFQFGGTSICRVPRWKLREDQKDVAAVFNGCRGCASGKGAGADNIFGNKYGQRLAAIQIRREELQTQQEEEEKRLEEEERVKRTLEEAETKDTKEKKKKKKHKSDTEAKSMDGNVPPLENVAESSIEPLDVPNQDMTTGVNEEKEGKKKKKKSKSKDSGVWAGDKAEEAVALQPDDMDEGETARKKVKADE